MKNRMTVILGAGTMIDFTSISTKTLTDAVLKNCKKYQFNSNSSDSLVDRIYNELRKNNAKDTSPNFEEIFHVLELLIGFRDSSGYKGYTSSSKIFSQLNNEFKDIDTLSIYSSANKLIATINDEIALYDEQFAAKGKCFSTFLNSISNETSRLLDIYNLNYDTWVEQSLGRYNDGFIDIVGYPNMKRFDINESFATANKHAVSHLHGQICFGYSNFSKQDINKFAFEESSNTLYKYANYALAKKLRENSAISNDNNQAGEKLFRTNIVTGLMKTDKLLWNPLSTYHVRLANSLMNNNQLVIVGYGFTDYYINNLLLQFNAKHFNNRKIVMIDYVDPDNWYPHIEHPFSPSNKALFTNYIGKDDYWFHKYDFKDFKNLNLLYTDNQDLCICKDGFKSSLSHMDAIIEHINSVK